MTAIAELMYSAEYQAWRDIRKRCNSKNYRDYHYYGGRGIRLCHEWNHFWTFLFDMGLRPSDKHSIDRINNDGNYEPNNCRWATRMEQARNTRLVRFIEFNGERLCVTDWAERFNILPSAMQHRISKYGEQKAIAMGAKQP